MMSHRLSLLRAPSGRFLAALACVVGLFATPAFAQLNLGHQWPNPRLNFLSPTGGKVGTSLEVTFNGTEVDQPEGLFFSHPGIKGTPVVEPLPKPDPKAKVVMKKGALPPAIAKFSVTIGKEVPIGVYDVRLVNKFGISNPRRFVVGDLNEIAEKEPNNDVEQAQKVDVGSTVNGVISAATDVDYFSFLGKKGQRVLVTCLTASIDSRLDPEMRVISPKGVEVAYYRPVPGQDGLVDVTIQEDGDYLIRLNKFTYTAGSPDFFYRLNISSAPHIDAIFPPMAEPGKPTQITLYGRNLPGGKADPRAQVNGQVLETLTVKLQPPAAQDQLTFSGVTDPLLATLDGFEYRLNSPAGASNPAFVMFARAPVILENDDNDTPDKAQAVPVPCEIAGRIDKKRDRDWYVFDAKKGDVLVIEVTSHRLGASTDLYFVLKNLATKQDIVLQDDNPESFSSRFFSASNRDPAPYRFVAPADGKYHLMLANHTGDNYADPTHVYRVRITPEKPDFRLFVMPADDHRPDTCLLLQGGTQHYTVYANRMDGFKGDIQLTMEGLPAGVTCAPQVLGGAMKSTQLVLGATDKAAPFTGVVKVVGTAVASGQKITHQARPATITWGVPTQQNIPTVTRLDQDLVLAVREKGPGKLVASPEKIAVSLGDKAEIPLKLTRTSPEFKANLQIAPVPGDMPAGMAFANVTLAPGKDEVKAILTVAANVPPGKYNVTFRGFAPISPTDKAKPVNTILISTPVELTVLPKQVATLSVDNPNLTVKAGAEAMLLVKVARLYDYSDAFKVELILPPAVKGMTTENITIGPGINEAKMKLRIPPGTPPANLQNLVLRATAVVNGNVTLTHEIKINVNIAK